MLFARFHALSRDCPSASRQIDLFPSSANRFVGTGRGQDEEGQSLLRVAGLGSQRLKERRGILVRQCRMMFDALHFGSFGQQMIQVSLPACGILASPIAANGRPVQDGFDPAAYPRGSFCLRLPDRLKYLEYERGIDKGDSCRAEDRARVCPQSVCPLIGMFGIPPARLVGRDVCVGALIKRDRLGRRELFRYLGGALGLQGINPLKQLLTAGERLGAGFGKADRMKRPQAHPSGASVAHIAQ